jgi:hypothetical protein
MQPGRTRNRFTTSFKQTLAAICFPSSMFLIRIRHTRTLSFQHSVVNNMLIDGPDRKDGGQGMPEESELSFS